jgi:hypothetical protein
MEATPAAPPACPGQAGQVDHRELADVERQREVRGHAQVLSTRKRAGDGGSGIGHRTALGPCAVVKGCAEVAPGVCATAQTVARVRRTLGAMPLPNTPLPVCLRCRGNLIRVPRRFGDRLLSLVVPVWRFRCADPACAGERLIRRRHPGLSPQAGPGECILESSRMSTVAERPKPGP